MILIYREISLSLSSVTEVQERYLVNFFVCDGILGIYSKLKMQERYLVKFRKYF